ncbi:hypothetical protein [Arthrobacter sp. ZGTC131]|uniref:hypothetical protein n=1 Tax=Arthrobacter sp. ZGTC131 TaxID=2058898 RepID=UPI000CE3220A|nr:hypothetical protein [Arthrobacter sp. ZGTC131]
MDLRNSLRLFRAALITAMAMSLASAGHVLGGGALPGPAVTAVLTVLLLAPVAWLASRPLSLLTLLGVLGAAQLILHTAFTSLSPGARCAPSLAGPLPHHRPVPGGAGCFGTDPAASLHAGVEAAAPDMTAGHLLALVSTAWLLQQGEEALWRLLAWLRPLVRLPRPASSVPAGYEPAAAHRSSVPSARLNLRHDSLRGPPAAFRPCTMP